MYEPPSSFFPKSAHPRNVLAKSIVRGSRSMSYLEARQLPTEKASATPPQPANISKACRHRECCGLDSPTKSSR